jgi:hypothetical protein
MSAGYRSASPGLGASAAPSGVQAGYASLLGPLGGSAPASTGAQAGYRSLLGPLGGSAATGGVIVTPDIIRDDIDSAFVVHFEGMRLSARQRRKLEELKKGIWHQAGQRFKTRARVRWEANQAAKRLRDEFSWWDERKVA